MKLKVVAGFAFLLNTFLFATYYSVAKEALERIDPIVFTFFTMVALVPAALVILAFTWRDVTRDIIKSGALLGTCLCLGLITLAVALKYNSATSTAFFPSLNGLLAAVFAWLFLRQPIGKWTWLAGLVSVIGAFLLITNSAMGGLRGSLIAFIGGLLCTFYVFLADQEQRGKAYWPLFAVELLAMAAWANLIALLFGDWQAVHPVLLKDTWAVLYISFGTTFLPTLLTVLLQKHIKPLTVSFIYILEPVLGAVFAYFYLRETMPLYGYLGGVLVVAGALINTWGTAQQPRDSLTLRQRLGAIATYLHTSLPGTLGYPLLCCCLGLLIAYKLGGFPPAAWRVLYRIAPHFLASMQQEPTSLLLLLAQALSWLTAWLSLGIMATLTIYRALGRLLRSFQAPTPAQRPRPVRHSLATYAYPATRRGNIHTPRQSRRQRSLEFAE